ncbi:unnamed protein product [Microthlaspi erraticum]|uniref:Uncharacterized protein n=1 Tax=Microthlaspi erraticum TaxID=1685480 RepID=A0A6D2I4K3_9BRAS|nr:unnamed protein product [Microthlaspi erraticum]
MTTDYVRYEQSSILGNVSDSQLTKRSSLYEPYWLKIHRLDAKEGCLLEIVVFYVRSIAPIVFLCCTCEKAKIILGESGRVARSYDVKECKQREQDCLETKSS